MSGRAPPIPSIDRLLRHPETEALIETYGRIPVRDALRTAAAERRAAPGAPPDDGARALIRAAAHDLAAGLRPRLGPVLNLTGTVLHTNLGRAPLPEEAVRAMVAAAGAVNLEADLVTGRRGERDDHVARWLCRLTGAEAATVVNNNAAAVLLALNTLARRREVPVSRGELIEIGGAFRLPDIMARAGARLVEVGTTNRTHPADYERAVGPRTAALMKVHTSNYVVQGFTASVDTRRLARIAREHGLALIEDLGSGSLVDLRALGLPREPTVAETVAAGADLVTFSGDKLLGGPQCGIVVGRAELVRRLARNPLKRALRLDKIALAALGAVLPLHADPDLARRRVPVLRLLARPREEIRAAAERCRAPVAARLGDAYEVTVEECESQVGSGALPLARLPSAALVVRPVGPRRGRGAAVRRLAERLRSLPRPVVGRTADDALVLDLRCLEAGDEPRLVEALGEPADRPRSDPRC